MLPEFALVVCIAFGDNRQCTDPLATYPTEVECKAKAQWLEAWHEVNVGHNPAWSVKCQVDEGDTL